MFRRAIIQKIFNINNDQEFNDLAIRIFHYQYENCAVYRQHVQNLSINKDRVKHYSEIPFLPIEFFKSHKVVSREIKDKGILFESSGTTGQVTSKHYVVNPEIYEMSFFKGFEHFYGSPEQYVLLALLPSYLERQNSSLVYMADRLIKATADPQSGFYLKHTNQLEKIIQSTSKIPFLLGVSFALLDMAEKNGSYNSELIVMETGGTKGRRKEVIRKELHEVIKKGFNVKHVHSEYGMTELFSQAYSTQQGIFKTPPWMKVLIRDTNDPLSLIQAGKTGGINVIDLANVYSCSFIATQDLGKNYVNGDFEVLGRFDTSDIRGCNLMF